MNRVLLSIWLLLSANLVSAETFVLAFHRSPPYSDISETGKPFGMDMEISGAISRQMGIQLKTLNCPLARCLQLMKEGQSDLILGLIKTDERQAFMAFVHPPYYTIEPAFAFYKKRDSDVSLDNYQGLQDYIIAVTRGGAYYERFDQDINLHKLEPLSVDNQLNLLLKNRVDLVIGVESTLDTTIGIMGLTDEVSKVAYRAYSPISAFMAVSRKSPLMGKLSEISAALLAIKKSGELGKILIKYNIEDVDLVAKPN